ncbi:MULTISPECIES: HAD-IA family hydrolase [Kitasatospora]|uniref:Putative hydrolase n=1 Tax=Kitasatospora setae (strain ATCC 33774 / DSM 43861 / JCM 3304 / KCC A-0304 / NBRC 14216 / KM-6054) TaxID=452652 RepID=E4NDJ4_KITSK|nr:MULTISPECIES: HAD-IA family hydrolase [Kitasatospora]BAJ29275.1 putative hydrolase [Kitasatospora setae KM-6054]
MAAGRRVGAVLCDLDGVLRVWGDLAEVDRVRGLPPGTVGGAAFRAERLLPAVTGLVSDEEWRAAVAADLVAVCGSAEAAREAVAAWGRQPSQVDADVLALVAEVRRGGVPVVLVSNGTTRLEADLAACGLDGAVDAVLNTARFGHAKPDPRVYLAAAGLAGVPVERCLFVDDSAGNVAAATALGMHGHHHDGATGLRAALDGHGLLG